MLWFQIALPHTVKNDNPVMNSTGIIVIVLALIYGSHNTDICILWFQIALLHTVKNDNSVMNSTGIVILLVLMYGSHIQTYVFYGFK